MYPVSLFLLGSLSRRGLIAYASSTDCVGPIASTVMDAATLLGIVAGEDRAGDTTALQEPVPDYTAMLKEVRSYAPPHVGEAMTCVRQRSSCDMLGVIE